MSLKFKQPEKHVTNDWNEQCFDELLKFVAMKMNVQSHDRIGFTFENGNNNRINFHISFRRFDQFTSELILAALDKVLQSNTLFLLDDNLVINVDHVNIPIGCGRRTFIGKSTVDFYKIHANSLYTPNLYINDGNICLPAAIIIGKAYADGIQGQNMYNFLTYAPNRSELIKEARNVAIAAGVDYTNGCGLDEIRKFQNHLRNEYNITVYNSRSGKSVYYTSPFQNNRKINLLLDENHYSVIKSLTAVFACDYFCDYCAESYHKPYQHTNCPFKCNRCFCPMPCVPLTDIKCHDCNRTFLSPRCFQNHVDKKICLRIRLCPQCTKTYTYNKSKKHICGIRYCNLCKEEKPSRHECFIPQIEPKKIDKLSTLFIFFDLECTQSKPFISDKAKFEHKPNLCVAHKSCNICIQQLDIAEKCSNCGDREHIFIENNIIECFMDYLGSIPDKFKDVRVIAHNLQKYDGHFILQHMYKNKAQWNLDHNSLVMNGSKILQIKVGRFRFIDSLNFFSVPLSKLPAMFSLQCPSKGYYPHFFNISENLNYIGPFPDASFYGVSTMKPDDRLKFLAWHTTEIQNNKVFDNRSELISYCKQDVNILRLACLKFRSMLINLTDVDPFNQITIAGTCMAVLKTKFLKHEQVAIIPSNGYRLRDNQSFKALKWLEWVGHTNNINIITALNAREIRLSDDIIVDGFHDGTVYEFYGCYWHQCPLCYHHQFHKDPNNHTHFVRTKYESVLLRAKRIKNMGYKIVSIWEHEYDKMERANKAMIQYLESVEHIKMEPLNPRHAFYGGRTGVCKLYHKVNECDGEKIFYYDVTSLYPFINKYSEYPVGIPKILIGNTLLGRDVFNINGIIKCKILPPKNLYHPVLPVKMHNKLLFILCNKCAENENNNTCMHDADDRSFIGTYVAEELRVAVEKGYTILKMYEAWEYDTTKYDPKTNNGGIFAEYINTFLKIKTESSGYPSWIQTDTDKDSFIDSFHSREGVLLNKDNIKKNPGLRSLSKICLNSIWGKFGERPDKVKKTFINERNQLLDLVTDPSYETMSMYMLSEDGLLVSYKLLHEANLKQPNVNVAIAAYTTAHARLHLYNYLDKLGERVLYYDTDSVFFTQKPGEETLPLGDYLGDLTNEIADYGDNSFIEEAVFTSEKSYAFCVNNDQNDKAYVCKVKGVTMNYETSQKVNFDVMKSMVLALQNQNKYVIKLNNKVILRAPDSTVYTTEKEYSFKVNATKRRKVGEYKIMTLPYGYIDDM